MKTRGKGACGIPPPPLTVVQHFLPPRGIQASSTDVYVGVLEEREKVEKACLYCRRTKGWNDIQLNLDNWQSRGRREIVPITRVPIIEVPLYNKREWLISLITGGQGGGSGLPGLASGCHLCRQSALAKHVIAQQCGESKFESNVKSLLKLK